MLDTETDCTLSVRLVIDGILKYPICMIDDWAVTQVSSDLCPLRLFLRMRDGNEINLAMVVVIII